MIDWGAVKKKQPGTTQQPGTPQQPPAGGGIDWGAVKKQQAGGADPFHMQKSAPLVNIAPLATGVGKLLDAQAWLVRKAMTGGETDTDAQMTKIRHKIPGLDAQYGAATILLPLRALPAI